MTFAAITGWGHAVPHTIATNADLASAVPNVDEEWIVRRSGIHQRHIASSGETTSTLAIDAGRKALAQAGVEAGMLDVVIVATCTPDRPIPGVAPVVQTAMGAGSAGAFDINAACAGFLTAYAIADSMIRAGTAMRALVIGAEVMSRFVDWTDPKTCVLFGDGAGAVVLERSDEPAGIHHIALGADGTGADLISIPTGDRFIRMNGPEVYRAAVRIMEAGARDAMAAASFQTVDLLIAHQANQRIIAEVGERLGLSDDTVFSNVARFGNTSAASIPIALSEAARDGRLYPGARFVLTAVGAGLTWAAGAGTWTGARTHIDTLETIGAHA
ncbi:MAG TPA: beta-ketoacyl-ACP synthase III [Actinomycetota bacterium]|nr:beta-ketoacyl-ACP synthase III [Actinomycetota bacterium]